jgi:hypothetical protein
VTGTSGLDPEQCSRVGAVEGHARHHGTSARRSRRLANRTNPRGGRTAPAASRRRGGGSRRGLSGRSFPGGTQPALRTDPAARDGAAAQQGAALRARDGRRTFRRGRHLLVIPTERTAGGRHQDVNGPRHAAFHVQALRAGAEPDAVTRAGRGDPSGARRSNLGMTATPKRQVSRTTPRNTTMVRNAVASLSGLRCGAAQRRGAETTARRGRAWRRAGRPRLIDG